MAFFTYTGFNSDGKTVRGTIEAPSESGAFELLSASGVAATGLAPGAADTGARSGPAVASGNGLAGGNGAASASAVATGGGHLDDYERLAADSRAMGGAPARPMHDAGAHEDGAGAAAQPSAGGDARAMADTGSRASSGRIPMAARTLFVRELATFLQADIPLLEALGVLRRQEAHPAMRAVLDEVHGRVSQGESFSHTLERYPRVFPPLLISMVRVGETGGMLPKVLEQMAVWMEHDEEVRGEIRSALAYPAMIVCLGIVTLVVLMTFVLPRITSVFEGMENELPLVTKLLMGASAFMATHWWVVLGGAAALVALIRGIGHTRSGRAAYDRLALTLPIFGALTRKSAIARFARAGASLLAAGVPLLEALKVIRGLLGNVVMTAMIDTTIERVTRGQSLARTLGESPWFPPSVVHLLGVGERTGRLGEMFERVAQTFEKQTRAQIKVMLSLLSPLMIVALAAMVAVIAIAILLPIFKMSSMMH